MLLLFIQWCYGINSASFINASLYPFVNQMELDEITGSSSTIELWKSNLMNTTEKTYDEIEGKISYQLEMAAKKVNIKNFLIDFFNETKSTTVINQQYSTSIVIYEILIRSDVYFCVLLYFYQPYDNCL